MKFQDAITAVALRAGATLRQGRAFEYQIVTRYGMLFITPYPDWIACRFDEPDRVPRELSINRWSGKWNFHPTTPNQSWVDFFEEQLKGVMP